MPFAPIKAMIMAAGRGERMRPLTDTVPKPLLKVRGKPLIGWHAEALARGGFTDLVINTAWLGEQVETYFSSDFGLQPKQDMGLALSISYSHEGLDFGGALETAGGIARALPLLGDVFWVLAGDVFVPGFEFTQAAAARFAAGNKLAHLWLVPNPAHNLKGDFGLSPDGLALNLPKDSRAQVHLQHHRPLPARIVHSCPRQPAGPESPTGAAAAGRDGQWPGQRRAVRRRLDRRGHTGPPGRTEPDHHELKSAAS
jgi:hypothetical protein